MYFLLTNTIIIAIFKLFHVDLVIDKQSFGVFSERFNNEILDSIHRIFPVFYILLIEF